MVDVSSTFIWSVIVAAAVGSFLLRLSFIGLFGYVDEVPPLLERALRYVPAAVLSALVLPGLVLVDGSLALSPSNERLIAGAFAAVVAWRTESMLATIGGGMGVLWTLTYLT